MSNVPSQLYCIHCKKLQPIEDVKDSVTSFNSKRNKVSCQRESWHAVCSSCKKKVQSFKKKSQASGEKKTETK